MKRSNVGLDLGEVRGAWNISLGVFRRSWRYPILAGTQRCWGFLQATPAVLGSPGLHLVILGGHCHTKNLPRLNLTAVSKCSLKFFYMNRVHSYMLTNQHMISSSLSIMWSCVDLSLLLFFLDLSHPHLFYTLNFQTSHSPK